MRRVAKNSRETGYQNNECVCNSTCKVKMPGLLDPLSRGLDLFQSQRIVSNTTSALRTFNSMVVRLHAISVRS